MHQQQPAIFMAHHRADTSAAIAIAQHLRAQGDDVLVDTRRDNRNSDAHLMRASIDSRPVFMLLLTPMSLDYFTVPNDHLWRATRHALDRQRRMVVVLLDEADARTLIMRLPEALQVALHQAPTVTVHHAPAESHVLRIPDDQRYVLTAVPASTTTIKPDAATQDFEAERLAALDALPLISTAPAAANLYCARAARLNLDLAAERSALLERGRPMELARRAAMILQTLHAAIVLEPRYADALNLRGTIYEGLGNLEAALRDYDRALAFDATLGSAYMNRSIIHRKMGNTAAADDDYARAQALDPFHARGYYHEYDPHDDPSDYR